ncbi:MAG: S8 family serine peptidase [Methanobacteriota archaeon]
MNIEFGMDQINRDAEEYFNSLPAHYKKMARDLRLYLKELMGYLPPLNKLPQLAQSLDVSIYVPNENAGAITRNVLSNGGVLASSSTADFEQDVCTIYATISLEGLMNVASLPYSIEILPNFHQIPVTFIDKSIPFIGADLVHNGAVEGFPDKGEGAIVGIMDTGIGDDNNYDPSRGYIPLSLQPDGSRGVVDSRNFAVFPATGDGDVGDSDGHGTIIAGIIGSNGMSVDNSDNNIQTNYIGVAPNAKLVVARVQSGWKIGVWKEDYWKQVQNYSKAINWLSDPTTQRAGVNIIQMSVGFSDDSEGIPTNSTSNNGDSYISRLVDYITYNKDILFVASAGNSGLHPGSPIMMPADAYNAVTVGAIKEIIPGMKPTDSNLWEANSSYKIADDRQGVELLAPGTVVYSTCNDWVGPDGGGTIDDEFPDVTPGLEWVKSSGTSVATPHVSGTAALVWTRNTLDNYPKRSLVVKAILLNSAIKPGDWVTETYPTKPLDAKQGTGILNASRSMETARNANRHDGATLTSLSDRRYYHFTLNDSQVPAKFSATLAWNRHISNASITPSPVLNNLNVLLHKLTPNGTWLEEDSLYKSTSLYDNVEHISSQITTPGIYVIEIRPVYLGTGGLETFGIAFSHEYAAKGTQLYGVVGDSTKPNSAVSKTGAYWRNTSPITITAAASDTGGSGLGSVELFYRFGAVNGTWTVSWTRWVDASNPDTVSPWSWSFPWPSGQGHYQFYTRATDNAGNIELVPALADVAYAYDNSQPIGNIVINGGAHQTISSSVSVDLSGISDAGSGLNKMRFANDGYEWTTDYSIIQSTHPVYPGDTDSYTLAYTGAIRMKVHFEKIDIRPNADFIYIKDSHGNILNSFTGSYPAGVEWASSEADGDIDWIEIEMVIAPQNSWYGYGFKIDRYSYYKPVWSTWEPFSASKSWMLSNGYGEKRVYCEISDNLGQVYQTYASIYFAPYATSVTVNGGAQYTSSNQVQLAMDTNISQTQMRFSNSASNSWLYKSNPGIQNARDYWWHLESITPIDPFPDGCAARAESITPLKGGAGDVQPPAGATTWRLNFAFIHLKAGDWLSFDYYVPTVDKWTQLYMYEGPMDIASQIDSIEIPIITQYSAGVRIHYYSLNGNSDCPFYTNSYEWRNNNLYYGPNYDHTWPVAGDPYAKVGISFDTIDLGAGDKISISHPGGQVITELVGPLPAGSYFVDCQNGDDIAVRLVSLNPNSRGWGISLNGKYCYDRQWSSWIPWGSTYAGWDLTTCGGNPGDGAKRVYYQGMDSAGNLGPLAWDDIIKDTISPQIVSLTISETSPYVQTIGTTLCYRPGFQSSFTILISAVDDRSGVSWATGATAFGDNPIDITPSADQFELAYTIESGATFSGNIGVTVYDVAGNAINGVIAVIQDSVGPAVSLSAPSDGLHMIDDTPALSWSTSDGISGPSGNHHLQVADDVGFANLIVNVDLPVVSYTFATGLDDGTYYWRVKAEDNVGNWGSYSGIRTFTVDTTAPLAMINLVDPRGTDPEIFDIHGISEDINFKQYVVEVRLDASPIEWKTIRSSTSQPSGWLATWYTDDFIDGAYQIRLSVTDLAGNNAQFTVNANVDNTLRILTNSVQAEPNPFVPAYEVTNIRYVISEQAYVTVEIFDSDGILIRTLLSDESQGKGNNNAVWDGKDDYGARVNYGETYNYIIQVGKDTNTIVDQVTGQVHTQAATLKLMAWSYPAYGNYLHVQVSWPSWNKYLPASFIRYEMTMELWIKPYNGVSNYISTTTQSSNDYYLTSFTFLVSAPTSRPPLGSLPSTWPVNTYKFTLIETTTEGVRNSDKISVPLRSIPDFSMHYLQNLGMGCPYVGTWNGTDYVLDNTILGESEVMDRPNLFVEDYYKLQQPMMPGDDGNYHVSVIEFENEHPYLDVTELLTVDHKPGTEIGLNHDDSTYTITNPMPPTRVQKPGSPLTNYLHLINESDDDEFIEGDDGFNVLVYFDDEYDLTNAKLVIRSDMKPGGGGIFDPLKNVGPDGPIVINLMNPITGEWENVGNIYPRALWSIDIIDLSEYSYLGNTSLYFMFEWLGHHKLDFVGIDLSEQDNVYVQRLSPSSATHSKGGLVTYDIALSDNRCVGLIPGEWMNITFPYAPTSLERDFILYSKGYYNLSFAYADLSSDKTEVQTFEGITFDASASYDEYREIAEYYFDFGDGANSGWVTTPTVTHLYSKGAQAYIASLIVKNDEGLVSTNEMNVSVFVHNRPPVAQAEVYQEIEITLSVTGRKDNTVGILIFEDGTLIQSNDVMRTAGPPNVITFELNKYLGRVYEIELVYDADYKGSNPTWLNFTSAETAMMFFKEFNTKNGYCQIISVPTPYLDDVVEYNPTYRFDASGSYDIDGSIVSYEWDFGDGTATEGTIVAHTFLEPGSNTVTLTVTDDDGAIARETIEIEIPNS